MKKIFTLLTCALMSIGSAWGADETLFTADFSAAVWSPYTSSSPITAGNTVNGIYFNCADYVADNKLYFNGGSNMGNDYYCAIHVTGVNGSVKIVVNKASTTRGFKYAIKEETSIAGSPGSGTQAASETTTTINYDMTGEGSELTFYFYRQGSGTPSSITGITITTPEASAGPALVSASSSPAASATNVAVSGSGYLKFSKALASVAAANITISPSSNGETLSGIAIDGTDATKVNYTWANLQNETEYSINIAASAVSDGTNTNTATSLSFTTVALGPVYKNDFTDGQVIWTTAATIDAACSGASKWMKKGAQMSGTKNLKDKSLIDPNDESQTIVKYTSETNFYMQNTSGSGNDRALYMYVTGIKSMALYIWNNSSDDRTYTIAVNGSDVKTIQFVSGKPANYTTIPLDPTANNIVKLYGSNQIELYAIKTSTTGEFITIGATGYATYSTDKALDFTGLEIKAYQVTGANGAGTAVEKEQITGTVAANTGLLVKGTAGKSYNVPVVASGTDYSVTNKMKPNVTASTISEGTGDNVNYVLMNNGGTAEFQWIGDVSANLGANKAYLTLANGPKPVSGSRSLSIDGDVTAIKNIKLGTEDNVYYDLQGRRVLYPTKGLYIVNGKKVIVK